MGAPQLQARGRRRENRAESHSRGFLSLSKPVITTTIVLATKIHLAQYDTAAHNGKELAEGMGIGAVGRDATTKICLWCPAGAA
jgi:hypothetical protein